MSWLWLGQQLEIVAAEGRDRQAVGGEEVADRIVGPGVADGDGFGDALGADFELVFASDLGLGPGPFFVLAADDELKDRVMRF